MITNCRLFKNTLNKAIGLCNKKTVDNNTTLTHLTHMYSTSPNSLYTQRAFPPSQFSQQLISHLPEPSQPLSHLQTILHQLSLYQQKILPFDYDYYCQSLKRLVPYQALLSIEDLLMVLEMAIEYKIQLKIIGQHFENQLHCKLYLATKKELKDYDQQVKMQMDSTFALLEKTSKDHFQILDEKFTKEQQEQNKATQSRQQQQQQQQQPQTLHLNIQQQQSQFPSSNPKHIYNSATRKSRSKPLSPSTLNRITSLFLCLHSSNIELNSLLLQLHSTRLDDTIQNNLTSSNSNLTPSHLLLYTKLTVNLLQLYMTRFNQGQQQKEKQYTHRSIKNIYKLQGFYYFQIAKLIEDKKLLENATNDDFLAFVQVISAMPIRRRSFRKSIGEVFIQQVRKRELSYDTLMNFFKLSKYDNQLLKFYQHQINGTQLLLGNSQHQNNKQLTQNNQALIPQVITQETKQLFELPSELYRKVTKKKSKSKKSHKKQSQEIDLTQEGQQQGQTMDQAKVKSQSVEQVKGKSSPVHQESNMSERLDLTK